MLITYPLTQPDQPRWPTFGCFHSTGLQFDAYTVSSRGLTAINRGNCITRTVLRRRHSDSLLLMLPNPHRYRWGAGGTGRPGCGARGRRGLAGQRADAPSHTQATQHRRRGGRRRAQEGLAAAAVGSGGSRPRCRWVAAGPGRASRSTTPCRRLACGDLAGGPPPTGTHSGRAPQSNARTPERHSKRGRHQPTPCASALTHP